MRLSENSEAEVSLPIQRATPRARNLSHKPVEVLLTRSRFPIAFALLLVLFALLADAVYGQTNTIVLQPNSRNRKFQNTCGGSASNDLGVLDAGINCFGFDSLLDFDLTPLNGVPASNIVSARLELQVVSAGNGLGGAWRDFQVGAYPNRGTWGPTTTWATAPAFDNGASYENRILLTNQINVWRSWDVTQALKDWVGGTQSNYGLRLVAFDNGQFGDFYVEFANAAHANPALRPRLVVEYQTGTPACVPPPSGLVSWWRAEGNANDFADSNHGTLLNGASFTNAGIVGEAFLFDGVNDHVQIADAANLDGMTELTVETWVKFHAMPAGKWQFVIAKGAATGPGTNSYVIYLAGDTLKIVSAVESTSALQNLAAPDTIVTGTFYHVAITYDGNTFNLYLNGVLKGSAPLTGAVRNTAFPLFFGRRSGTGVDGNGDALNGVIDETSIYNRALTASEVGAVYAARLSGKCTAVNHAPTADAGSPQSVGTVGTTASVTLNGSGTDPDGDSLSFNWTGPFSEGSGSVAGQTTTVTLPVGVHTITLTVDDGKGGMGSDTVVITVADVGEPDTLLTNSPSNLTNLSAAKFEFVGSDTVTPAANLTFECSLDSVSFAGCTSPKTYNGLADGVHNFQVRAVDSAGNADSSPAFFMWTVDTQGPMLTLPGNLTAEAASAAGATVVYSATANDANDGPLAVSCTPPSGGVFAIGSTTVNCSAQDAAGNTSSGSFTVTVQDTTGPLIDAHANVTVEATGASGATVSYSAPATHDAVDGDDLASCLPASGSLFTLGNTTVSCNATDSAGNPAASTMFVVHVVDTTPPTIDARGDVTAEATGASGATVSYSAPATHDTVDGDGLASCLPASGSLFTLGNTTVSCNATDSAGNPAASTMFVVHVVDTTPPTISGMPASMVLEATSPSGAVATWASPSASDLVDGPVAISCLPVSGSTFALGTHAVACTATDAHGNTAIESFQITVQDTIAPSLVCGSADGLWHNTDVSIGCTASDSGSGLANPADASFSLVTSVSAGTETANAATGSRSVCDAAGNCATAGPVPGNMVDKKPPVITLTTPPNGANYGLNAVVAANYSCDGGLSGTSVCAGTVAHGANINTAAAGGMTFTVSATDGAGNTASVTHNYTVQYSFVGFLQPIDNLPVINQAKPGKTIPVKWQLKDANGNYVSDLSSFGSLLSAPIACDASPTAIVEEQLTSPGSTVFRYDATSNQFVFNWQSSSGWKGCRLLQLTLADGTVQYAKFNFK